MFPPPKVLKCIWRQLCKLKHCMSRSVAETGSCSLQIRYFFDFCHFPIENFFSLFSVFWKRKTNGQRNKRSLLQVLLLGIGVMWKLKSKIHRCVHSHCSLLVDCVSSFALYLIHGPCNQHRRPQRDPACHRVQWRSPDYSDETEAEVVGHVSQSSGLVKTILPARHCEGSKEKGKTKEVVGRPRQKVDRTTFQSHRGLWKTDRDGGSWLRDLQWCPYDPLGQATD